MTDIKGDKSNKIESKEDVRAFYTHPVAEYTGKMGLEVEMALYRPGTRKPVMPTAAEMLDMQKELKEKGYDAQLEAAGVLEYASPPVKVCDVQSLIPVVLQGLQDFEDAAAARGYARLPFCILPTTTLSDAFNNLVSRERLVASISSIRATMDDVALNIPLLTTGVQTSFSPSNADEMFRMTYRAYALTPLLIAAMNSSAGFVQNDPERQDAHIRAKYYEAYGEQGGIAESFLASSNGQEFVDNHIDAVFRAHMHFAYDMDGSLIVAAKDAPITFERLAAMGLNTQKNYELAESFIYNDVKICNLPDANGNTVGKRVEVRAADSGLHQPVSTLLLTAAFVPDGALADAFDALLKKYGFAGNPVVDADLFRASRKAAVEHDGRFMDVPFGTGSLKDFAAEVAELLPETQDTAPLIDILRTGDCDAKRFKQNMPTLKDVTDLLQERAATPAPGAMLKRRFG